MWHDILIVIGVSIALYSSYNCISTMVRGSINISKVSEKLYAFSGKVRYYPLLATTIFIANIISLYKNGDDYIRDSKIFFAISNSKIIKANFTISLILISLILISLLLSDFVLSIYIKPVMYEEGILCSDGKFISWINIKSIAAIKFFNKRYILVNNVGGKDIYLRVNKRESSDIKEIMFNKSGIVSKEIVT